MIIGLCLRLALHDLFSQAFPLLIIDEGTTHMDQKNCEIYFSILQQLKQGDMLKQIIVIDHHPQLSQVVDQVIQLPLTA